MAPDHADQTKGDRQHDRDRLSVAAEQPGQDDVNQHARGHEPQRKCFECSAQLALPAAQLNSDVRVLPPQLVQPRLQLGHDLLGIGRRRGVGGDGHGPSSIQSADQGVAGSFGDLGHFAQRNPSALGRDQVHVLDRVEAAPGALVQPHPNLDILALGREDVRLQPKQCPANLRGHISDVQTQAGRARLELHLHLPLGLGSVVGDVVDTLGVREHAPDPADDRVPLRFVVAGDDDRNVRPARAGRDLGIPQPLDVADHTKLLADGRDDL